MGIINQFKLFISHKGFFYPEYEGILEISSATTKLQFLVNGSLQTLELTGKEKIFWNEINQTGIFECDGKHYEIEGWDGYHWSLEMQIDDKSVCLDGTSDHPDEFASVMKVLFRYGLRKSENNPIKV